MAGDGGCKCSSFFGAEKHQEASAGLSPKKEEGEEGAEQFLEAGKRNLGRGLPVSGGQCCYLTHPGVMLQEAVLRLLWGW